MHLQPLLCRMINATFHANRISVILDYKTFDNRFYLGIISFERIQQILYYSTHWFHDILNYVVLLLKCNIQKYSFRSIFLYEYKRGKITLKDHE